MEQIRGHQREIPRRQADRHKPAERILRLVDAHVAPRKERLGGFCTGLLHQHPRQQHRDAARSQALHIVERPVRPIQWQAADRKRQHRRDIRRRACGQGRQARRPQAALPLAVGILPPHRRPLFVCARDDKEHVPHTYVHRPVLHAHRQHRTEAGKGCRVQRRHDMGGENRQDALHADYRRRLFQQRQRQDSRLSDNIRMEDGELRQGAHHRNRRHNGFGMAHRKGLRRRTDGCLYSPESRRQDRYAAFELQQAAALHAREQRQRHTDTKHALDEHRIQRQCLRRTLQHESVYGRVQARTVLGPLHNPLAQVQTEELRAAGGGKHIQSHGRAVRNNTVLPHAGAQLAIIRNYYIIK